jgi:hypothetical protein
MSGCHESLYFEPWNIRSSMDFSASSGGMLARPTCIRRAPRARRFTLPFPPPAGGLKAEEHRLKREECAARYASISGADSCCPPAPEACVRLRESGRIAAICWYCITANTRRNVPNRPNGPRPSAGPPSSSPARGGGDHAARFQLRLPRAAGQHRHVVPRRDQPVGEIIPITPAPYTINFMGRSPRFKIPTPWR